MNCIEVIQMTTENNDPYAQFNAFINSDLPDEYKEVLKHFQEQGLFYQQLIQKVNNNEPDLSEFWNLPNTLGFDTSFTGQPEWFQSIFNMNDNQGMADISSIQQFIRALSELPIQAQDNISTVQATLSKMNRLNTALSESAMKRFQTIKEESPNPSNEQLCTFWLTAGEEAFSEISQTDEYIDTQKELLESLSELKKTQYAFSEQLSNVFGLPSRQSLEDLQKGMHKLRIEFAEYKEQTDTAIAELRQTIRRLK